MAAGNLYSCSSTPLRKISRRASRRNASGSGCVAEGLAGRLPGGPGVVRVEGPLVRLRGEHVARGRFFRGGDLPGRELVDLHFLTTPDHLAELAHPADR